MKITIQYAKIINVENLKSDKNIKKITVSNGKDKGFSDILWITKNKSFDYFSKIKKGDAIYVPSGDLGASAFYSPKSDKAYANIQVWTNYVEKIDWAKSDVESKTNKKEAPTANQPNDSMDDALSEFDNEPNESNYDKWKKGEKQEQDTFTQDDLNKIIEGQKEQEQEKEEETDVNWDNL